MRLRLLLCLAFSLFCLVSARGLAEDPAPAIGSGNPVEWEGWKFRWAIRQRAGLVLTEVEFRGRKVLKYAGLEEIFVPYDPGQPRPEDSIDGMGINLIELIPGKDCLPGTTCQMMDAQGKTIGKRLVGMHEESTGLAYVHDQGRAYGKMLVLWCASKLGNYTYFIRWKLRDDGRIMPEVGLTGDLGHLREGESSPTGSLVERKADGKSVWAPSHVHNFYYRLDLDIDGAENDVVEEFDHYQDQPGRSLASHDRWTPISKEGARSMNSGTFRSWRVADRVSKNQYGLRRSYELVPGGTGVFRGAAHETFAQADLWVTRFKPREFPFSAADRRIIRQALPTYTNDEDVDGQDVVVWYAMHVHHVPRTEDWPAMAVEWAGFELVPRDFLDTSPLHPVK
jgi:primary-amine oxidase